MSCSSCAGHVRLVGQERAPSECVLVGTCTVVRKDMRDWILSHEGNRWSGKLDVRDLGEHLGTTFRGWSATLASRVRLVISMPMLVAVLPLDFQRRLRVIRSMFIPGALHSLEASLLAKSRLLRLRSSYSEGYLVSSSVCGQCWCGAQLAWWPSWV